MRRYCVVPGPERDTPGSTGPQRTLMSAQNKIYVISCIDISFLLLPSRAFRFDSFNATSVSDQLNLALSDRVVSQSTTTTSYTSSNSRNMLAVIASRTLYMRLGAALTVIATLLLLEVVGGAYLRRAASRIVAVGGLMSGQPPSLSGLKGLSKASVICASGMPASSPPEGRSLDGPRMVAYVQ